MTRTLRLAGFFTRAVALALDGAIVTGATVVIEFGVSLALGLFGVSFTPTTARAALGTSGWILVSGAYFISFWTLTGETLGMRFMGIKVIAADGGRPSFGQALRRSVGMALCAVPAGAGFLLVLVDDQRRGPHDRIASTLVVQPERGTPAAEAADAPPVPAAPDETAWAPPSRSRPSAGFKEIAVCAWC